MTTQAEEQDSALREEGDGITSTSTETGSATFSRFLLDLGGQHNCRNKGRNIIASTQLICNTLTWRAFLLCLTFVKLVLANVFGILANEVFVLHFVFLIFKSKYFCTEKCYSPGCCSAGSEINLVQDKMCTVKYLFSIKLLPL